jgi:hypothetical protein
LKILNINQYILHGGLALSSIIVATSIGYYLLHFVPERDTQLATIEKQKLVLQQKQIDLDKEKLLFQQQATISAIQASKQVAVKKTGGTDCESIAHNKARELLAKKIQMNPGDSEAKKAYDLGLANTGDIDYYFNQCLQANGLITNYNLNVQPVMPR